MSFAQLTIEESPRALYVHIPFCKSRCFYCDFTTYVAPTSEMEVYALHLEEEVRRTAAASDVPLSSVFFGGGTPTRLPSPLLKRLLKSIWTHFDVAADAEVTMEANPGSVHLEQLKMLRDCGVNRISFGAQSFSDRLLMTLGRLHDARAIEQSVSVASQAGFSNVSVDLMFGLPDQHVSDVRESVLRAVSTGVQHVSAYWLKVEDGTPFARWQSEGNLHLPGEDEEADMYELVRDLLTSAGFRHYEISNFAQSGFEARHNLVYWRNQPYFGVGAGAHGWVGDCRLVNVKSLVSYANRIQRGDMPWDEVNHVSRAEAMETTMMLGLRLAEGVSERDFEERYGLRLDAVFGDVLRNLESRQWLEKCHGSWRIPHALWPVSNEIVEKFVDVLDVD